MSEIFCCQNFLDEMLSLSDELLEPALLSYSFTHYTSVSCSERVIGKSSSNCSQVHYIHFQYLYPLEMYKCSSSTVSYRWNIRAGWAF